MLFKFDGRIGRKQWWICGIVTGIVVMVVNMVIQLISGFTVDALSYLTYIPSLAMLWIFIALDVKRLRDRGKDSLLMFVLPIIIVPWGFCVTASDEIWVCGSGPMGWGKDDVVLGVPPTSQVLVKFSTTGKVLEYVVIPKGKDGAEQPGELNWVHSIAVDKAGNLYCGDINGKRAQKFVLVPSVKQAARQAVKR